jgi:hypothetical protein
VFHIQNTAFPNSCHELPAPEMDEILQEILEITH